MDVYKELKLQLNRPNIQDLRNPDIDLYVKYYKGYDSKFHDYWIYNGKRKIRRKKKSLLMGKTVAESWANLLLNEHTDIVLPEQDQEVLEKIFEKTGFWVTANEAVEKSFALSCGAFVVRVENIETEEHTGKIVKGGDVDIEFINATNIYPISFKNGVLEECAFATLGSEQSEVIVHYLQDGRYFIDTYIYRGVNKDSQTLVDVKTFDTKSNIPWFTILKPNITNNKDVDSLMGISIYANAIDELKAIDTKYDSFDNEFFTGKKRIFVATKMINIDADGTSQPFDPNDTTIHQIPLDDMGNNLISYDTSALRSNEHTQALNGELSMLAYKVGLGKGFYTFNAEAGGRPIQTATGVIAQNSDLFRNVHKHEILIEKCLIELVKAIIYACNEFTNIKFSDKAADNIEVKFDDSIFEDKESEKETDRKDVALGVMSKVEYRMKHFSEDEETAKKKLYESPEYVATLFAMYLPALTSKAISPKKFVEVVYGKEDSELVSYIEQAMQSQKVDPTSLLAQLGND